MTAEQAAQRLGVSRSTLQRLIKDKELVPVSPPPSPRLLRPRRLLFSVADVERLANAPPAEPKPRKPRKKRNAPPDVVTDFAVDVYTPPTVAAVERLLVDTSAPTTAD